MHQTIFLSLPVADLPRAPQADPGMYTHAFADPDGHEWGLCAAAQGPAS
ncbi:hypothetical protein [Burkholderia anthina]|nr:hypothetical protein [Burkholderia anthina]